MDAASHEMLMRRYVRHHAQQANCLKSLLAELDQRFEGIPMRAALCGSGGAALAEALDLPYRHRTRRPRCEDDLLQIRQ